MHLAAPFALEQRGACDWRAAAARRRSAIVAIRHWHGVGHLALRGQHPHDHTERAQEDQAEGGQGRTSEVTLEGVPQVATALPDESDDVESEDSGYQAMKAKKRGSWPS